MARLPEAAAELCDARWCEAEGIPNRHREGFGGLDLPDPAAPPSGRRPSVFDLRANVGLAGLFILLLLFMWAATRLEFSPGTGFRIVTPEAVSGDEPQYLIVVNSLLFDHDLELQDDYARAAHGGLELGALHPDGIPIHHTILVNRRTGAHGLWITHVGRYVMRNPDPALAPSPDLYEVSAHPIAFPALLALALAPFHPARADVERDVGWVLLIISWLGVIATYLLARRAGLERRMAMSAALLLAAASPWLPYSRAFFPETTIGLMLVLAMWALTAERPALAALAAAGAAALKPPFAVVGAGFILELLRERRWNDAVRMGAILGVCGLALGAFNYWLARTVVISGGGGWQFASGVHELCDTLLGSRHGLLMFAPWTLLGLFAIGGASPDSALLRRMALPFIFYLTVLSSVGFGPGDSYGPRYWVSFLPWLSIAAVLVVARTGRAARLAGALLVLLGLAIAIPGAMRYPQLFTLPPWAAWARLQ